MKTYKANSLIHGYRLGRDYTGYMYVAVPAKYSGDIRVEYMGQELILKDFPKGAVCFKEQNDKFRGGTFTLAYFVWGGITNKTLIDRQAERPEEEVPPTYAQGKIPNALVKCPACQSGMLEYMSNHKKIIQCVSCLKIL